MPKDKDISDKDLEGVSGGRRKLHRGSTPDFGVGSILGAESTACSCGCSSSGTWTSNKKTWTDNKSKDKKDKDK